MIRVWGGGCYPEDWFYDLCDEMGFLVWQDFMFACSVYELTPEFEANIRREFADNIKRIRHHASLGLWSGNNEMEMFADERCWVTKPSEVRDYLFMYERIIPEVRKNTTRRPFTGLPVPHQEVLSTIPMILTEEMCITGRSGTETVLFLSTGSIFSAMLLNSGFRHFHLKRPWNRLRMTRTTLISSPM